MQSLAAKLRQTGISSICCLQADAHGGNIHKGTYGAGGGGGQLHRAACRDHGRALPVIGNLSHSLGHLVNHC